VLKTTAIQIATETLGCTGSVDRKHHRMITDEVLFLGQSKFQNIHAKNEEYQQVWYTVGMVYVMHLR